MKMNLATLYIFSCLTFQGYIFSLFDFLKTLSVFMIGPRHKNKPISHLAQPSGPSMTSR